MYILYESVDKNRGDFYILYKIVVLIKKFYNIRVNKCDVWVWIGNIVWFEMLDIVVYKLIGCLLI